MQAEGMSLDEMIEAMWSVIKTDNGVPDDVRVTSNNVRQEGDFLRGRVYLSNGGHFDLEVSIDKAEMSSKQTLH